MNANDADLPFIAEARRPSLKTAGEEKEIGFRESSVSSDSEYSAPTEEELATLRRVSGPIPWQAYTIALVEFCERFSWYGTTAVFVNFIQQPLPGFSTTGAIDQSQKCDRIFGSDACNQAGALGRGQQTSTGLTTFNQFWAYVIPLFGGWVADEFWGRYKTIQWAILAAVIGHILLVISAIPQVIATPNAAIAVFSVGLVVLGFGTGGFKSNISPLLAEQLKHQRREVVTLPKTGERVIRDPAVTVSRVYLYFYFLINMGSLIGGIGMVYAERYVGFWLAYALPTFLFFGCPLILKFCKKRYQHMPPAGSVLGRSIKLAWLASKGRWSINPWATWNNMRRDDFWHSVKPSVLGDRAPAWMADIDDQWVDQVKRGFAACRVFTWYPLYWLAYNQMVNNLTSQSATMELGGVPNDVINNLNPLTLIIFIPIIDFTLYPALRKAHIRFTPIKRITFGFFLASAAMISATVTQYYIYKTTPCAPKDASEPNCTAPLNVWIQTVPYCLVAFSEIFASITGLEYAFTKAPENMRSLVQGVFLLQSAFAAAIGQAFVPLLVDPLLTWNYGIVAVLAFVGGVGFWFTWRDLDREEDALNSLAKTAYKGELPKVLASEDVKHL